MANRDMADSERTATTADDELQRLDAGVSSASPEKAGRGRAFVGALAIIAVALVGGGFILNAAFSEDGTTEAVEEVEQSNDGASANEASAPQDDVAADNSAAAVTEESSGGTSQSVPFFGDDREGSVLFVDGEFVSLGGEAGDGDGVVIARSADGVDWTVERTVGFPELSSPEGLVRTDDGWVALVTQFEERDESSFFVDIEVSTRWIATSTDLVNWTTVELPNFDREVEATRITGLASSGNTIAILAQPEVDEPDEIEVLFNAGLLAEEDVENYCGSDFFAGEPFIAFSCEDGGQVELLRLEPGDPVYDEVVAAASFEVGFERLAPLVMAGPVSGPFEVTELQVPGFGSSLVGSEAGFTIAVSNFSAGDSSVWFSEDGVDWRLTREVADPIDSLAERNGTVAGVFEMFSIEGATSEVSVFGSGDSGALWFESSIPTAFSDGFAQIISGPAGLVVSLNGSVESGNDFGFDEDSVVEIQSDGFTMIMPLGIGDIELIGPDGQSVYGPVSQDVFFDGGPDAPLRFEGPADETLIWLDPDTGADLVSFGESDFIAAIDENDITTDLSDVRRVTELWFSVDGQDWALVHTYNPSAGNGFTTIAGIGDDEILLRNESFQLPPEELLAFADEGREPNAEEEAALNEWSANQSDAVTWEAIPIG